MQAYRTAVSVGLLLMTSLAFLSLPASAKTGLTNSEIAKILIAKSRSEYSGNCPCPYDTDRRGHSCGKRSAYSRPGGEEPLCYEKDVPPSMIEEYRKSHQ